MLGRWQTIKCEKCTAVIRVGARKRGRVWVGCRSCGEKIYSDSEGIFKKSKDDKEPPKNHVDPLDL